MKRKQKGTGKAVFIVLCGLQEDAEKPKAYVGLASSAADAVAAVTKKTERMPMQVWFYQHYTKNEHRELRPIEVDSAEWISIGENDGS